jgi:hypothetical protein
MKVENASRGADSPRHRESVQKLIEYWRLTISIEAS